MTNAEILENIKNGVYKKPNKIIENNPDVALDAHGNPLQFKKDELPENMITKGKGRFGYSRGKRIDKDKFMEALAMLVNDGVPAYKACQVVGLSNHTFTKRANEILSQGYLPWYLFEDGKPLYLEFEDDRLNELLKEYRRVQ